MRVALKSPVRIEITGIVRSRPNAQMAARAARALQAEIASAFEKMRTYAGRLKSNSAAYNLRKVFAGLDPRLGHRTGRLQRAIDNVRCWKVLAISGGYAIIFSDAPLFAAVGYAKYYARAKTKTMRIMGVTRESLTLVARVMRGATTQATTRTKRALSAAALVRAAIRVDRDNQATQVEARR